MIQKIWKFILFILPWTRSTIKDAKEILGYVEEGLSLIEKQGTAIGPIAKNILRSAKEGL